MRSIRARIDLSGYQKMFVSLQWDMYEKSYRELNSVTTIAEYLLPVCARQPVAVSRALCYQSGTLVVRHRQRHP